MVGRRRSVIVVGLLLIALPPRVTGQTFEVAEQDTEIAPFAEFTPVSGEETAVFSTSDRLRFSSGLSTERSLWTFTASASFATAAGSAASSDPVPFQGVAEDPAGLVYGTSSSTGAFTPLGIVTAEDLTAEVSGWTEHAGCGTLTYQGRFEVPSYTNGGVAAAAAEWFYQVCDDDRVFIGASRDLSSGDMGYVSSKKTLTGSSADYELLVGGNKYVFSGAADATSVTLRQGRVVSGTGTTTDVYALVRFPDGFPAGAFAATVTATATDITV